MKTLLKAARAAAGASVAALTLASLAGAAQADDVRIYVADLNLQTKGGVAEYNARVDAVAREMCAGYERLRDMKHSTCVQAVRAEAKETMEKVAKQGDARIASVRVADPNQDNGR